MSFLVKAQWDDEAQVWIATSEEIPGLCAEAPTFEELVNIVTALAPELLEANKMKDQYPHEIPIHIQADRQIIAY